MIDSFDGNNRIEGCDFRKISTIGLEEVGSSFKLNVIPATQ
jgi:hypothetical protein